VLEKVATTAKRTMSGGEGKGFWVEIRGGAVCVFLSGGEGRGRVCVSEWR
jgi:hypothetical protein